MMAERTTTDFVVLCLFILGVLGLVVGIVLSLTWDVSRKQTIQWSDKVARGTFRDFFEEFHKRTWTYDPPFPTSFFEPSTDSMIHAGVLRFDGVGMLLTPWSYWRVRCFLRERIKERKLLTPKIGRWGDPIV